jgi:hypothetical protein
MLREQDGESASHSPHFRSLHFFVLHPTDISELPDKNLDHLTFMKKFIMHNASNNQQKASSTDVTHKHTCRAFWDEAKQDSSSVRTVVWFQSHSHKPMSHHQ